jgi:hypothetical protein
MAREKPLDLAVVKTWLASWGEGDLFSDAAVEHLQSLFTDVHCLVVVTLDVSHEPRSLVFRRVKRVGVIGSIQPLSHQFYAHGVSLASSLFVSPVAPVAPPIGQLWHQTGVKSETVPKLERVLR